MVDPMLVESLHELRVARGRVVIKRGGGFRCLAYQKAIHISRAELLQKKPKEPIIAAHTLGQAADVRIISLETGEGIPLTNDDIPYLKGLGFNGIGIGKTGWAHLDIAHSDEPATWSYDY